MPTKLGLLEVEVDIDTSVGEHPFNDDRRQAIGERSATRQELLPSSAERLRGSLQPGDVPRPLTRKEVLAFPPSPEAYFHASYCD